MRQSAMLVIIQQRLIRITAVVNLVQEKSPQVKKDELTAPSGKSAVKLPGVSVTVIIIQTNLNITVINDHYHPNQSYHHHCLYHQ